MATEINRMFSKIYQNYDFMNHLFSFNFDKLWRSEAAKESLLPKMRYDVLDVASGTGDLAIAVSRSATSNGKQVKIFAYDFNKDMLDLADLKFSKMGIRNIKNELGSAFRIRHKSGSFDVITSGFALRSFANSKDEKNGLKKFLAESHRLLRPGGKIVLLDMAMPDDPLQKAFFSVYSHVMLSIGSLVEGDTYAWLVRTIKEFDKKRLAKLMSSAGFKNVRVRNLPSGIAFIASAER